MPAASVLFHDYLEVWNTGAVERLADVLAPTYTGHMRGSVNGDRDSASLATYIVAFRERFSGVSFTVLDQVAADDVVASRLAAMRDGREAATGMNFSRWENGRLAEEWALWSPIS